MDRFDTMKLEEIYQLVNGAYYIANKGAGSTEEEAAVVAILRVALNKLYDLTNENKEGASDD